MIESIETADLLKELVRRGVTYAGDCRLIGWTDNSKGSFVRFALDQFEDGERVAFESPFKGCKEGAKDGQKFFLLTYMLSEQQNEVQHRSLAATASPVGKGLDSQRDSKSWGDYSPAQQAGIRCSDPEFQAWLGVPYVKEAAEIAARIVREKCGVTSRSEIIPGTDAFVYWKAIDGAFQDYQFEQRYT